MIICEPVCNFNQHIPINVSMIKNIIESEKTQVLLLCTNEYWCELQHHLPLPVKKLLTHIPILVISRADSFQGWLDSFFLLKKIHKLNTKDKETLVFLTTTTGILGLSQMWLSNFNTQCIVHMVLSRVDGYIPRNPFRAWFTIKKMLLRFKNDNCKIVVLERHILSTLVSTMPHLKAYVKCVLHPLPEGDVVSNIDYSDLTSEKIVCFPGTFNVEKGAELFCQLAKVSNDIKLVVAGKLASDLIIKDKACLFAIPPAKEPLARDEFSRIINNSHFMFLGHDPGVYKWIASGVYLDALVYEKPIIAQRSIFFENEFKRYGDFGFLFEDISELEECLTQKLNNNRYLLFKKNIISAKIDRSVEFNRSIKNLFSPLA